MSSLHLLFHQLARLRTGKVVPLNTVVVNWITWYLLAPNSRVGILIVRTCMTCRDQVRDNFVGESKIIVPQDNANPVRP